jgi:hypothetical protein
MPPDAEHDHVSGSILAHRAGFHFFLVDPIAAILRFW